MSCSSSSPYSSASSFYCASYPVPSSLLLFRVVFGAAMVSPPLAAYCTPFLLSLLVPARFLSGAPRIVFFLPSWIKWLLFFFIVFFSAFFVLSLRWFYSLCLLILGYAASSRYRCSDVAANLRYCQSPLPSSYSSSRYSSSSSSSAAEQETLISNLNYKWNTKSRI